MKHHVNKKTWPRFLLAIIQNHTIVRGRELRFRAATADSLRRTRSESRQSRCDRRMSEQLCAFSVDMRTRSGKTSLNRGRHFEENSAQKYRESLCARITLSIFLHYD